MAKDLLSNDKVVYDIDPSGSDAAIAKDMKARGITPANVGQYIQNSGIERDVTNQPKDLLDPLVSTKRESDFGAIQKNEPPGFWKKESLPLGGATIGGIAGTAIGGPIGGLLGAAGGGFLGQLGSQKLLDQPLDVKSASQTGALMGAGQGLGDIGFFVAKKAWPYIGKEYLQTDIKLLGEKFAPYVDKYLPVKQKVTQAFYPYQMAAPESAAAKWQNITESSFGGRAPTAKFHWAQKQGAKEFADETASVVWDGIQRLPPEQVGKETLNAYELAKDASKAVADKLYKDVDDMATQYGNMVDYAPVTDYLKKVLVGRKSGRSEMGDTAIKNAIDDMSKGVDTFVGAQDMRSRLGQVIGSFDDRDPGRRLLIKAKEVLDNAMDTAADNANPQIKSMYQRAKSFYKEHLDTYQNDFMRSFADKAKTNPSVAVDMFIKADQPELINTLWKATGGKNTQAAQNIQAMAVEKWLTKVMQEEGSQVIGAEGGTESGKQLWNILKTMDGKNGNLRQIFPDKVVDRLWETAKILSTTQKTPRSGGGGMLIQLIQSGALMTGAGALGVGGYKKSQGQDFFQPETAIPMVGAAAILFTPKVIAKLLVHPVYGKWFIEGLDPKSITTKSAYHITQTINKLVAAATDYYVLDQREQQQKKTMSTIPGQRLERPKYDVLGLGSRQQ